MTLHSVITWLKLEWNIKALINYFFKLFNHWTFELKMSIKFHMTFWRTIILSLFTQLQKYVLKETFGIEKQFYLWKCFQTKAVFSTFYTYSANDNKLIFSKYIIFGLIYNIDSFVTVVHWWLAQFWLSVVVLSIVSYWTINCVANQKHSKLLSFVQLSFPKLKFSLTQASILEYSMMDCMFSRYIYPANGS